MNSRLSGLVVKEKANCPKLHPPACSHICKGKTGKLISNIDLNEIYALIYPHTFAHNIFSTTEIYQNPRSRTTGDEHFSFKN
jgi:hypothetical protein